jgi:hypothetical protein
MNFPIVVETVDDQVVASLAGVPEVKATGATRPEALKSLQGELVERIRSGELDSLNVPPTGGILNIAGKYADDPTLEDICKQAYAERDAERDRDSE